MLLQFVSSALSGGFGVQLLATFPATHDVVPVAAHGPVPQLVLSD